MLAALGPDLARPVVMSRRPPAARHPMGRIFNGSDNIHKLRHYLPIYEGQRTGHRAHAPDRRTEQPLRMRRKYLRGEDRQDRLQSRPPIIGAPDDATSM